MKRWKTKGLALLIAVTLLLTGTSSQTLVTAAKTTKKVNVTNVTITKPTNKTLVLTKGKTYTLKTSVSPSNASNKKLEFISSNNEVASITATGKIKAIKNGKATISVKATDGSNKKDSCTVLVKTIKPTVITGGGSIEEEPIDDYTLVWSDDFSGNTLDLSNWNMELRNPGWVNNELQAYTDSPKNIYVKNGKLVIKANKAVSGGTTSYTSGKVTTQNKQQFKYGKFVIKAKVPSGQGLWPAIWMMSDENLYGQWPKCGEIDIMEILGNEPNKLYGTIHYGAPHAEQQGTYILKNGTFADDYHVYSLEWEPSEMRFYIDGHLFKTVNDWFTKVEGQGEITYPAPFDQPFFLQMNLAVGGSWPGNPDATTNFENAKLQVDYVKVYQRNSYDENVTKPIKDEILREPDAKGNYIINGDFKLAEDLTDTKDWSLLTAGGGEATASIAQNIVRIDSTNFGTVSYAIQLVQPKLPMKKGGNYRLTFDAKASADRKMIVAVTAPDKGWIRYMPDTEVKLTTSLQSYSYDFSVTTESDVNGRIEYNLGLLGSLAKVEISNVKLMKLSETVSVEDHTKAILPDGNYVYNGTFQEGPNRMDYWTVENKVKGAKIAVTNTQNIRELKIQVPNTVSSIGDVTVKQTELAISANKDYTLSFDAYGSEEKTIQTKIDGHTFDIKITATAQTFKYQFTTGNTVTSADLEFLLGKEGTTFLDNVQIKEAGMLINGDFASGLSGWEVYIDSGISTKVSYVVDGLIEDNAAEFTIKDTGDQAYKIQLKQNNVTLQQGKWYKLSIDAKSNYLRKLMVALQRDGSADNDWTPYGEAIVDLSRNYETYEIVFKMQNNTDAKTILSISMGAVAGIPITDAHKLWIDNVLLEEIEEPVTPPSPGTNLIKNGNFSQGQTDWIVAVTSPGAAEQSFIDNKAVFNISNIGSIDWHIQLKQSGLSFEKDKTYHVKMKITSSVERTVRLAFMSTSYDWYGGADESLLAGKGKEIDLTFTMNSTTDQAADFVLSMGYVKDLAINPGVITIENISIIEDAD